MNRRVQSSIVNRQSPLAGGFSLVEALVAVSVTAIAGGALLTSIGAAIRTSSDAAHTAVARGLAEQMMDEIAAARFPKPKTSAIASPIAAAPVTFTAAALSAKGLTREAFDTLDDYDGWACKGPVDRRGHVVGTEGAMITSGNSEWHHPRPSHMRPDQSALQSFTREVQVERIRPDSGNGWTVVSQATDYRRVTVRVKYTDAQGNTTSLAEISRIFSHVPVAP